MKQFVHPLLWKDYYKVDHRSQYPKGTQRIYSNWTPRMSRVEGQKKLLFLGLQLFLQDFFQENLCPRFFDLKKDDALKGYKHTVQTSLGPDAITFDHIEALWDLGYPPIRFKALPEGELVNMGIPCFTCTNTHDDFAFFVNMLETVEAATIWGPSTSATTAFRLRLLAEKYARLTNAPPTFVPFQMHDFSLRGMMGIEAGTMSDMGHLLSFLGTDTIPSIPALEHYYDCDATKMLIGTSVPATEHSVMCMGGPEGEYDIYVRLITEVYTSGIAAIVSDTYNLWNVICNFLPKLKDAILARKTSSTGIPPKIVIRPDSGDPVKILCGDPDADGPAKQGVIQLLWEIFGGETDQDGFKHLCPFIGAIYGDSITYDRAAEILKRLYDMKFATDCLVMGVGSFTYQYTTRDVYGTAMKATHAIVDGAPRDIFKDPQTDGGKANKKSAKGLLCVTRDRNFDYHLEQQVTVEREREGELKTVFEDGVFKVRHTLPELRERVEAALKRELN
jgi:nicotinamide phosphoribosyltransferase